MVNIYSLMTWLKKKKIKTVLTHHAEFMFTGGCGFAMCDKWKTKCEHCPHKKEIFGKLSIDRSSSNFKRFEKAFSGFSTLTDVYVSSWLQQEATLSPVLQGSKGQVVLNPIDTSIFSTNAVGPLPKDLQNKKYVFLPISKFGVANKGANSIDMIADRLKEVHLMLAVAGAPSAHKFLSENVVNLGFLSSPAVMAVLYRNAVCTLIVSKVESFSMPAAESLCCGTPIAGFKAGGPESFADAQFSEFVNVNDLGGLVSAIVRLAGHKVSLNAACIFEPKLTAEQYLKLYQ
jgi:glycosyltransferase involved in cell wall biosynthesis